MLAPSHIIVGVVSAIVASDKLNHSPNTPFVYLWAILGSLLPDIDHRSSRLGKLINPLIVAVIYFLLLSLYPEADFTSNKVLAKTAGYIRNFFTPYQVITFVAVLTAAFICQVWAGHRTITHSLFIGSLLVVNLISNQDTRILAFSVAYLSHIFLDMFSPEGVQLFYPYGRKVRLWPPIPTGSFGEGLAVFVLVILLYLLSPEGYAVRELLVAALLNPLS